MVNKIYEDLVDKAEDYADKIVRPEEKDVNELYSHVFYAYLQGAMDERDRANIKQKGDT